VVLVVEVQVVEVFPEVDLVEVEVEVGDKKRDQGFKGFTISYIK
jgi:hypothetical protein